MIKRTTLILLASMLAACNATPTDSMAMATQSTGRVKVERIGVIEDDIAYGDRRGVYVITDNQTGTEFIGVSGVGITETGSHKSGKTRHRDER